MGVAIPKSFVEPASSVAKWRLTIGTILVLVVAFAVEALAFGDPIFPVDDAYITLHNALVLREGHDAHYLGVPALVGATSGAHVALTALLSVAMPATWALWSACRLAVILYALGLLRIAFAQAATWPIALVAMVAGMTAGYGLTQLLNGLETSLAMAAVAWTLALASEPRPFERTALLILIGVLPFVRPELAALSGLVFLLLAYEAFRSVEPSDRKRLAVRMLSLTALGAIPLGALYWVTTGLPFPNTVQAKKFFFADGCASTLYKLDVTSDQLYMFGQTIGVLSRAVFLLLLTRVGIVGFVFILSVLTAYFLNLPGALAHYEQRYLYIVVPVFVYGACSVFTHRWQLLRFVGPALLVIAVDQSAWLLPDRWKWHLATKAFTRNELKGVAEWSEQHLPKDARLLVHDAGYIAWGTKFALHDMVGLKTPRSVAYHRDNTWLTCVDAKRKGHSVGEMDKIVGAARGRAISEIGKEAKSTHLVVLRGWNDVFGITANLTSNGWALERLRDGPTGYDVYALTPPR